MTGIEWTDVTAAKACANCRITKALDEFARDASRPDGRTYWCSHCRNERSRRRHVSRATGKPSGPPPGEPRDGDKAQARRRVNVHVRTGRWPHPNTLPCTDCGHIGPGSRHEYDHHLGYGAAHHEHVEAVCAPCHHRREAQRANGN